MRFPPIDTRPNKNVERRYVCTHVFPELTAVCPVTRLPDFYTMRIVYEPERKIVELKSFKLYLVAYRNVQILHEEITNRILDDFISAVRPRWAYIEVKVNVRGGIATTITRHWKKRGGKRMPLIHPRLEETATWLG